MQIITTQNTINVNVYVTCTQTCTAASSSLNFRVRSPCDCLGKQFPVVRIFESGGAVAELDVNDFGFAFISSPGERFSTFRMGGGEERSHVRCGSVAPVDFVVQVEVGEAGGYWMLFRDDFDWYLDVVLVAELVGDVAFFVLRFGIGAANDALEFRP